MRFFFPVVFFVLAAAHAIAEDTAFTVAEWFIGAILMVLKGATEMT
jgi:hypothetical protein